jgi:HEAT repeat protein
VVRDAKHPRAKDGNHRRIKYTQEAWAIVERQPRTDERIFPYNAKSVSAAFTRSCHVLGILTYASTTVATRPPAAVYPRTMSKRKGKTAAELMTELEKDPSYLEQRGRQEVELHRREEEYARAEAPLVRDLRAAGSQISSVWDLVNTAGSYPALVPILLAHLDRPYPERVREGIARALALPEARQGWDKLVNTYLSETDATTHGIKWALHLAIAAAADLSVLDTLIRLAADRRNGRNRAMFVDALARLKDTRARATLDELAGDPDLADEVQRVLKKRT